MSDQGSIKIIRREKQPVAQGARDNFTGQVEIKALLSATGESRTTAGQVTFQPGARTVWHTHPVGQALVVIEGQGRVRQWEGPLVEIGPGDVVWFPAGVKHWHGASPRQSLTHIAIQEELEGRTVEWLEAVTDEQYQGI